MAASGKTRAYILTCTDFVRDNPKMAPKQPPQLFQTVTRVAVPATHWEDDERIRYGREFVKLHQSGKTLKEIAELRATSVNRIVRAMRAVEYDPERVTVETKPRFIDPTRPAWTYPDATTLRECRAAREEIERADRRTAR